LLALCRTKIIWVHSELSLVSDVPSNNVALTPPGQMQLITEGGAITYGISICSSFLTTVRPAKAGMFSGRQSHRDKSQDPVAWITSVEETKLMKPIDKAILGMVSESPGRNVSEPTGGLDKK
jgi:hypothetical protein